MCQGVTWLKTRDFIFRKWSVLRRVSDQMVRTSSLLDILVFFFIFIKNYSIYAQCDHPFSENVTSVEKCSLELRVSMFAVCPLPSNRIHLEPLSHILDKVGSLLPINKFFVVFYPTLSAGGIQKLFFCEYPSLPRHLHNSEENGKDACSSEIHRTGLNL